MVQLDPHDLRLLEEVQADARRTETELGRSVGLTKSPVGRRLKRFRDEGIVAREVAIVDRKAVGISVAVIANVRLSAHGRETLSQFQEAVRKMPEVLECYRLAGTVDYVLHIVAADIDTYDRFLLKNLLGQPSVDAVHSQVVLETVKYETRVPIELVPGDFRSD